MKNKLLLLAMGFALITQMTMAQVPSYVPTNGVVGYWPFQGNANDLSGNGNNGIVNGATLTADRFGNNNKAYSFNGTSNNINIPSPFLGGGQTSVFSFYARVNFNSLTNSPNIWGKTLFWGEVNFYVNSNGAICFVWANSITGNKYSAIFSNNNIVSIGNWYDIAIVFENSIGKIYVNGNLISTNLGWGSQGGGQISRSQIETVCNFAQDSNSSKFGSRVTSGVTGAFLNGKIDDIGIWNRALTQAEITNLYTAGTTFFNFCLGAKVSDLVAATGKNVKVYTTANGAEALEDIALTGTAAKPVAYYLSEQTGTGESSRVPVYVIINVVPATPTALVLTNDNAVLPAISTKAITAVGVYTGTNTPLKLSVTATGALSYKWTLPLGVERTNAAGTTIDPSITSTEPFVYVKFTGTGVASPIVVKVQSVNASGCTSAVKASASLTRLFPAAPAALVMNNGINTTAITSFAKYMGTSKVVGLCATATPTASSYYWELPTGVNRVTALDGGTNTTDLTSTAPFIYVNFSGVTKDNTATNEAVAVLTKVLRIGVKSVNGVGSSVTVNATAANPSTSSTAKLLTLTAVAPAAPASLVLNDLNSATPATAVTVVSKYVGSNTTLKLTAAPSVLANSYSWELPSCVTRVTDLAGSTADNSSTSTDPFIYVKFNGVTPAAGSIYFGVKAVNGVGSSVTSNSALVPSTLSSAKLLKLATVVPAAPASLVLNDLNSATPATAVTVVSKYVGSNTTLKLTAAPSVLANSYSWELPSCVTRVTDLAGLTADNSSTSNDPFIYVKFSGVTPAAGSIYFGVKAVNNLGASSTVNTGANSTRTDKLLTVRGGLPAVVLAVSGSLSVCNRSEGFSYTITAPVGGATKYIITAPAGSVVSSTNGVASAANGSSTNNVLTTSDLTFKVVYNGTAAFSTTDKSLVIRSVNAFGPCLTTKALALTKQATCSSLASTVRLAAPSVTEAFSVIAYPNPSSDVFTLEVQSSGKGKATTGVQVYDMAGRLIEKQQIISNSLEVGKNYAAGIYNITVSQGNNVKTIQIIKK